VLIEPVFAFCEFEIAASEVGADDPEVVGLVDDGFSISENIFTFRNYLVSVLVGMPVAEKHFRVLAKFSNRLLCIGQCF
jgi:hypothetical protein